MKPLLIACDFDGTITQRDTLHVIVERYGDPDLWDSIEVRLRAGELTIEQAMALEFAAVRATPEQVAEAVATHAPIRRGFVEFVRWCERAGHDLVVLSNGFRSIIEPVLAAAGLAHLDVVANDARFAASGCVVDFADRGAPCDLCGRPCKRAPLADRWEGQRLIYIGDGISDRCVCLQADVVFARDGLATHLGDRGVAFTPFDDFLQVRAHLDAPVGAAT